MTEPASSSESRVGSGVETIALVVLVLVAFGASLGSWPLFDVDEGRNALIALEMARSGDLLLPTINGLPFLDKPFLYFATSALSIRLLGPTEAAVRLPSALFALGTIGLVAWFARREFGLAAARIAVLSCASIPLFLVFGRTVILDSCLSFLIVAAILAFERAIETFERTGPGPSRRWLLTAWLAMALGILVKGPVALLVPLLVAGPYAAWRRRSIAVWWLGGPLLLVLILVPWVVAMERLAPGFLRYELLTETVARVATDELRRTEPFWFFLPYLIAAAFPWSWLAIGGAREAFKRGRESFEARRTMVFLALWFLVPLLLFSIFRSKRAQYIVPLLPALGLWVAWLTSGSRGRLSGARVAAAGWIALAAAAVFLRVRPEFLLAGLEARGVSAAGEFLVKLAIVAAMAGAGGWWLHRRPARAAWALAMPVLLLPMLAHGLLEQVAGARSGRALAQEIEPLLDQRTEVVFIETFSPSMAFYLERPLVLSSADGGPLTSNSIRSFYSDLVGEETGPLRDGNYWRRALDRRERPRVFVTNNRHREVRAALLERGLRERTVGRYQVWMIEPRNQDATGEPGAKSSSPPPSKAR